MARTRRSKLGEFYRKDPWCGNEDHVEWYSHYEERWMRGFLSAPIHYPTRDGKYFRWRDCNGPNLKRWAKKMVRRGRRRTSRRIVLDEMHRLD